MHASSVLVALAALASTAYASPQMSGAAGSDSAIITVISTTPMVSMPSPTGASSSGRIYPSSMPPFPFPSGGNMSMPGSSGMMGTGTRSPITISSTVVSTATVTPSTSNGGSGGNGGGSGSSSGSSSGSATPSASHKSSGAAAPMKSAGSLLGMGVIAAFFL